MDAEEKPCWCPWCPAGKERDRLQAELDGIRHTLRKAYRRGDEFARRLSRVTDPAAAARVDRQLARLRQLEQKEVPRLIQERDALQADRDRLVGLLIELCDVAERYGCSLPLFREAMVNRDA